MQTRAIHHHRRLEHRLDTTIVRDAQPADQSCADDRATHIRAQRRVDRHRQSSTGATVIHAQHTRHDRPPRRYAARRCNHRHERIQQPYRAAHGIRSPRLGALQQETRRIVEQGDRQLDQSLPFRIRRLEQRECIERRIHRITRRRLRRIAQRIRQRLHQERRHDSARESAERRNIRCRQQRHRARRSAAGRAPLHRHGICRARATHQSHAARVRVQHTEREFRRRSSIGTQRCAECARRHAAEIRRDVDAERLRCDIEIERRVADDPRHCTRRSRHAADQCAQRCRQVGRSRAHTISHQLRLEQQAIKARCIESTITHQPDHIQQRAKLRARDTQSRDDRRHDRAHFRQRLSRERSVAIRAYHPAFAERTQSRRFVQHQLAVARCAIERNRHVRRHPPHIHVTRLRTRPTNQPPIRHTEFEMDRRAARRADAHTIHIVALERREVERRAKSHANAADAHRDHRHIHADMQCRPRHRHLGGCTRKLKSCRNSIIDHGT